MKKQNSRSSSEKNQFIIGYRSYLESKGFTPEGINTYANRVKIYLQSNPDAESYGYRQVLSYFESSHSIALSDNRRKSILMQIKKYYDYLLETGVREDHPCRLLNVKGRATKGVIHSDLLSSAELELLLSREERFEKVRLKNQVILSLLIYQGLMPGEIIKLKTSDIDLDAGTVRLRGGRVLMARTLQLLSKQILMMDKYINKDRKKMLRTKTDSLIINYRGEGAAHAEDIGFIIEGCKGIFAGKDITTKTIRDSVISNWLNERKLPLEQVQLMAGHRWISCTERYLQVSMDEQREILRKFHPLG